MDPRYTIKELSADEFFPLFDQHKNSVFDDTHSYDPHDLLDDDERRNIAALSPGIGTPYRLQLGVFDRDDNFVGWSWGAQDNRATFYMTNSAVLPDHRRRGIYTALLQRAVAILTAKGFQLLYSRHCATNNAVIIPKLKAGFIISKMEINDQYGILIHLHFYTNPDRRKIMDYRSGQIRPDATISQAFRL